MKFSDAFFSVSRQTCFPRSAKNLNNIGTFALPDFNFYAKCSILHKSTEMPIPEYFKNHMFVQD